MKPKFAQRSVISEMLQSDARTLSGLQKGLSWISIKSSDQYKLIWSQQILRRHLTPNWRLSFKLSNLTTQDSQQV
jgi:hypothetical protein